MNNSSGRTGSTNIAPPILCECGHYIWHHVTTKERHGCFPPGGCDCPKLRSTESAATPRLDPPFTTALKWCPVCGRTDRSIPFTGQRHSSQGKRCDGTPVTVVYEFKKVLPVGV